MFRSPHSSKYDYWFEDELLCLRDLNGGKSLTNDIEHALAQIAILESLELSKLAKLKIMYCDSQGQWDGVRPHIEGQKLLGVPAQSIKRIEFFSLGGTTDFETAKYKRLSLP